MKEKKGSRMERIASPHIRRSRAQDRKKLIRNILVDTPCSISRDAADDVMLHETTLRSEKVIVSDKC